MKDRHLIKVFLIDDEPLAIEGWKNLLNNAGGFQIVGDATSNITALVKENLPKIDIVIAGVGLLRLPSQKKVMSILRSSGVNVKIVMIANDKNGIAKAQRAGIDEAILSPFQRSDFLNLLRGLYQDPKRRCVYYVEQLDIFNKKGGNERDYGSLIGNILEFLFAPHLMHKHTKHRVMDGYSRCNILFENRSLHPFWERIRMKHKGERILFSVSFNNDVKPDMIGKLSRQLTKEIGGTGVMVTNSVEPNWATEARIALYRNEGKVLIFLSDVQITSMLVQKAVGIDSSEIFQDTYEEFIAELSFS